jgi:hypothetical protein
VSGDDDDAREIYHHTVTLAPGEILILERKVIEAQLSFAHTRKVLEGHSAVVLARLDQIEQLLHQIAARVDALLWAARE